jgi:Peptidase family M28
MRLADLVAVVYGAFDAPAAMSDVAALCQYDRYQASAGLDEAAAYVAERATAAGLLDVEVLRFPADGARRWWTFAAALRWTPRRASVLVNGVPVLGYPEQPYALALYSAATPPGGLRLPLVRWPAGAAGAGAAGAAGAADLRGAMVVLEGTPLPVVLGELISRGAHGVVTDPLAGRARMQPDQVGRLELPAGCPLFAFSATQQQLDELGRAALRGATAQVSIDVDTAPGTLPVVIGRLAGRAPDNGRDGGELLLSAHLCHPRPSANDNASGVAALLGIARAYTALGTALGTAEPTGLGVRFVWGSEFVGLAAYLHDVVHAGHAPRPIAAVNVDMAGEDQRRCGGPLVIERAPDELPSPLSAVAARCATLVPAAGRSYSGAAPCDTWAWRATPYSGTSDHAVLAGQPTRCPAISLGHWPDAANHTSADTIDLVDPGELRRTATIAGATLAALRGLGGLGAASAGELADVELAADVADATLAWAANHVLSALPGSRPQTPPPVAGPVLDPWAAQHAVRLLDHRATVALNTVEALSGVAPPHAAGWIAGLATHARTLLAPAAAPPAAERGDADVLVPRWVGPMNLRHLAECAAADDRRWLAEITVQGGGGNYARLLALARGLDGRRDRRAVAWWAALSSELAIPVPMAQRFLELLCATGWATPGPCAARPAATRRPAAPEHRAVTTDGGRHTC